MSAIAIHTGAAKATWPKEDYTRETLSGYRVERRYRFMSEAEFFETFKKRPGECGLVMEPLQLCEGQKPSMGILLRDSQAGVTVVGYFDNHGHLAQHLVDGSKALRQGMAQETQNHFEGEWWKSQPRALKNPMQAPSMDEVPGLHKAWLEKQAQMKEEEEAQKAVAPVTKEEVKEEESSQSESEEEEVINHATAQPLYSGIPLGKKGKDKGKGKGKGKKAEKPKKNESKKSGAISQDAAATKASSSRPSESVATGDSDPKKAKRNSGGKRTAESYTNKAKEWCEDISIVKCLEGESIGKKVWGSEQTLRVLQTNPGAAGEALLLETHLRVAKLAEDCWSAA